MPHCINTSMCIAKICFRLQIEHCLASWNGHYPSNGISFSFPFFVYGLFVSPFNQNVGEHLLWISHKPAWVWFPFPYRNKQCKINKIYRSVSTYNFYHCMYYYSFGLCISLPTIISKVWGDKLNDRYACIDIFPVKIYTNTFLVFVAFWST